MNSLWLRNVIFIILLLSSFVSQAQNDSSKIEFNGYISNMQSIQFQELKGSWINDNLIHNRLNFNWYPNDHLSFKMGIRNRIFTGESVKLMPDYGDYIHQAETGYLNLSWNAIDEQSVLLNINIDRLFFQYESGKFSATIGRQRINWGKTFVWNPNDIFNTYSFFDFDYAERPGSDALRLQYYTSEVSSVELATKIDKNEKITAAGLWRFNMKEYDFQLMGGLLNSSDYTIGAGWSGAIKNIDFKGELSYFMPIDNIKDTAGLFMGSVSLAYTFPNGLSLLTEFLYTGIADSSSNFIDLYSGVLSVKSLSFTKYNLFGQVAYQITPLLMGSISAIYYPDIKGYFIGPSFDYSFSDNLFASFVVQGFSGEIENPFSLVKERLNATYCFLRLKWNF